MSENEEIYAASQAIPDIMAPSDTTLASHEIDWWGVLTDPEFLKNPYPELNRIRDLAPIHFDSTSGIYFVLGFPEFSLMSKANEMGRDLRFWVNGWNSPASRERDPETYELFKEFQPQMINANQPDHRRMRGVYEMAFRPIDMAQFLPMIEKECRILVDAIPENETVDFMAALGNPLPHRISLNLFDISHDMAEPIWDWIAALSWLGNIIVTPDQKAEAKVAQTAFKAFFHDHFFTHHDKWTEGFMGMTRAAFDEGTMDEEETLNNLVMLVSGSRTTLTLLGNGLVCLLDNPDEFAKLRADRSLMRSAIEEMLRFEPGSSIIPRAAVTDYQCTNVTFPAGSLAIGLVGAISRDPQRFDAPNTFDITRQPNPHLVFGAGPHVCIGKSLARMTTEVALTMLMDRFAKIELAGDPQWWTDRSDQRGLHHLPLRFSN